MQSPRWLAGGTLAGVLVLVSFATAQTLVRDINQTAPATNPGSAPAGFWSAGAVAFLPANDGAHGLEPWRTDGTAAGTVLIDDIWPGSGSSLSIDEDSAAVDPSGRLYFVADDGVQGRALWRTDGTAAGTFALLTLPSGGSFDPWLTSFGSAIYFVASDGMRGAGLWRTDGTPGGTTMVMSPGNASLEELSAAGGALYFIALVGGTRVQLWRSDGTAAGTSMLYDFGAFLPSPRLGRFTAVGSVVCFVGYDAAHGSEPWRTDGTAAGTSLVADIEPGGTGSAPSDLYPAGSDARVVFRATTRTDGSELWTSDGSMAGTVRLSDIGPGALDGDPRTFTRSGASIYFVATTHQDGTELWALPVAATGASLVEVVGRGCAGSNGQVPAIGTSVLPTVGEGAFAFELSQALPNAASALNISPVFGVIPLPPCTGYLLSPYAYVPAMIDVLGRATVTAPIPADPAIQGLQLYAQFSLFDQVGPRPITLSDALSVVIGR